ncbi:hypothetical protein MJA45_24735 [Paenibacillus aurantius]|uniref:Uncharacterized protein n=1 Tax=Paenibacillus aurantius TaxID=2918900 RepID=A0AA96LCS9_9BACL|nr:hypothetical protein [Paenibacillus aurantius]WNQ10789.1 hypothetical protein MJA45_24735 [Paenibacillus aurantius]
MTNNHEVVILQLVDVHPFNRNQFSPQACSLRDALGHAYSPVTKLDPTDEQAEQEAAQPVV